MIELGLAVGEDSYNKHRQEEQCSNDGTDHVCIFPVFLMNGELSGFEDCLVEHV